MTYQELLERTYLGPLDSVPCDLDQAAAILKAEGKTWQDFARDVAEVAAQVRREEVLSQLAPFVAELAGVQ